MAAQVLNIGQYAGRQFVPGAGTRRFRDEHSARLYQFPARQLTAHVFEMESNNDLGCIRGAHFALVLELAAGVGVGLAALLWHFIH